MGFYPSEPASTFEGWEDTPPAIVPPRKTLVPQVTVKGHHTGLCEWQVPYPRATSVQNTADGTGVLREWTGASYTPVCRQGWYAVPVAGAKGSLPAFILSPQSLVLGLWKLLRSAILAPGSDSDSEVSRGPETKGLLSQACLWQGGAGSMWMGGGAGAYQLLPSSGPSHWNPSFRNGSWSFWSCSLTWL